MRGLAWAALLICGVTAIAIVSRAHAHGKSVERGRREGIEAAERDIARGTPSIRRLLRPVGNMTPDGIGIDEATGLPLRNTMLGCGNGVDSVARAAGIAAYNARILEAHRKGELRSLTLGHKLRTPSEVQALFDVLRPVRLSKQGDRAETAGGEFAVAYGGEFSGYLTLARRGGVPEAPRLLYPWLVGSPFPDIRMPPEPFDVLFADDDTTAVVRDGNGFAWIIDLPRGIPIQVLGLAP